MENIEIWFAVAGIAYGALSDVIGLNSKWKSNSVVQLVMSVGKNIFKKGK